MSTLFLKKTKMEDRIALVTGANRGIGLEVCRQLAEAGYITILTSRGADKGKAAADKLGHDKLRHMHLDVADAESIDKVARQVEDDYGRLDVLVNNAGIMYDTWQQAHTADMGQVDEAIRTNLMGPWRMCRAMIPLMQKHNRGRVVNVSSEAGSLKSMAGNTPAYSVTKAALNALTINLAAGLQGSGILINSVCPGWVRTDLGGESAPRSIERGAASIMWAVNIPDDGPSGGFYRDGEPISF
ncbi:MAG: SDR family oxidoreductase [Cyclobacteriaceae bacterium]